MNSPAPTLPRSASSPSPAPAPRISASTSASTAVSTAARSPAVRPAALIAVLAFAGTVFAMMQSLVIPALPRIQASLGTSADGAAWISTAYQIGRAHV